MSECDSGVTRTEVDFIVREHIEQFLNDLIDELQSRGINEENPINDRVGKKTLYNALRKIWLRYL